VSKPSPASQISLWADQLRDISALGLRFTKSDYEREHFQNIQAISMAMFALASGQALEEIETLRETVFARPTPLSVGDGAVINAKGEILLIQRADNQHWAMPGGGLMVGETPAEGVEREVFEETGLRCRAVQLAGVHDSRLLPGPNLHQLYMFLFVCEPLSEIDLANASHANETLDCRWFGEDYLPTPLDPTHVTRIPIAFQAWHSRHSAFFDPNPDSASELA
jgi:8-oxo-dGTP pyrophosphatase MutT (NUDIX family)